MNSKRRVFRLWVRGSEGNLVDLWVVSTDADLQIVRREPCIERVEPRADIFPSPIDIDYVLPVDEESLKRHLTIVAA